MSACWISFTRSGVGACWPRAAGLAFAPFFPRPRALRDVLPFLAADPLADCLFATPELRSPVELPFFEALLLPKGFLVEVDFFLLEVEEVEDALCCPEAAPE